MDKIMGARKEMGPEFFDDAFHECYQRIGYPKKWIAEGLQYKPEDAYVISHPSWFSEDLPAIPGMSIFDLFKESVNRCPEDVAVIFFDRAITYRELDKLVGQYASLLTKIGMQKGDVIATLLPNSLQHIVAMYGAWQIGAIHCPINVMYQPDEVAYQVEDSRAKCLFILDLFYDKAKALHQEGVIEKVIVTNIKDFAAPEAIVSSAVKPLWDIPKPSIPNTMDFFENLEKQAPLTENATCDPITDTALLLYTAGTTGKSKGVIETHFNLVFNSLTHTHGLRGWIGREVNFSIMPMFHTGGYLLHLLPTIYQGGTVIPIPMFDVKDAIRVVEQYRVNVIFAPPTFFIALMSCAELLKNSDIDCLRLTIGCGAPVPVAVQDQWSKTTGVELVNGWGMTETNSGGVLSIPGRKAKSDALGVPIFAEVKVADSSGTIVNRNVQGEIYYRGLQVARGYLNKPEQTTEAFLPDGWFRTGDSGFIDDEDFVHFVDRIKDLIVASGYNIAPVEVEDVIYRHPSVAEAAVVGVPHEYRGETVKAVVALKPEHKGKVTEQELIDHCKTHLATFKVPRQIVFMEGLPKNAVGKILRRKLRD
ncbi:long-chain-fatty-acid--CoA ligase [Desulfosarcina alkanivorans]|jgi:long-chain acyl-CoA synthetase|uniref:Long-chain-fatty-acid--CoA ligase n=1 Tax=Desulfosarcina alkanivorans TaxID=571177 RepID=A0A5K7YNB9_9BACT|nr:AMP-binding protein [Desulfosarcina alkanivorans]BBO69760.1 long-chain-fatty-acid--CoA ligase [Desulfosarcina alkanivorans]